MTKKETKTRDKMKHSANAFRRNAPKQGRGGKGTWGNPLDDLGFVDNPPMVAIDQGDPNYVPDELPEDFDVYEEDVWQAEHETYDAYFDGYVEEEQRPLTMTEQADILATASSSALDMVLNEELPVSGLVDHLKESANFNVGTGSVLAKCFFQPAVLNSGKHGILAEAMLACLEGRVMNSSNVDNAFLESFAAAISPEDFAQLGSLAEKMADLQIWVPDKLEEYARIVEADDTDVQEEIRQMKSGLRAAVREYFSSTDMDEVIRCIFEICPPFFHYEAVKIVVNIAMDQDSKCRELASQLVGQANVFSPVAVCRGFEILVERLDDINKDVPDGTALLSCFIARAITDEAIPPVFVMEVAYQSIGTSPHAITCLQKVQHLLSIRQSAQRLSLIWGPGRGRPIQELKEAIGLMINAFLRDNDLNELATSLHDLGEPNFHHEFVKQAVIKATDKGESAVDAASNMIQSYVQKDLIQPYQVRIGMQRLLNNMDNYAIDSPRLPAVVDKIQADCASILQDK